VQVLAGVVEVDDLRRLGELRGRGIPDPGGSVAEDGELADVVRAAADAFGFHQVSERASGLEGRDDAGGGPVPDRVAVVVEFVLDEEDDAELDFPGPGPPVFALALPSGCSPLVTGTPVPSMAAYSLSGSGDGGSGTSLREPV
jgi:hypothetical protein